MMRCPLDWEVYRRPDPWTGTNMGDRSNGYLLFPKRGMKVIFSNGGGWEHVSISFADRCPTWAEMEEVKRRMWEDTDCVMQLHVPVAQHRNFHPHCLHLWRPLDAEIPMPPGVFVAPESSLETTGGQS
jgi:hypothetical protein